MKVSRRAAGTVLAELATGVAEVRSSVAVSGAVAAPRGAREPSPRP